MEEAFGPSIILFTICTPPLHCTPQRMAYGFALCSFMPGLPRCEPDYVCCPFALLTIGLDHARAVLKLLTLPLTKQQTESTAKMQAIQPAAKKLQEKYRNGDPVRQLRPQASQFSRPAPQA